MYVDSGATETVMPDGMLMSVGIREGAKARQGITYEVANGVSIANLGEREFVGVTEDGQEKQLVAQVCEVNKVEPESAKRLISTPLKEKLQAEAEQLNMINRHTRSQSTLAGFFTEKK